MEDTSILFDQHLSALLKVMVTEGVRYAAHGFSGMVGRTLTVSQPHIHLVPLADIPNLLGGPESEAVGIYLRTEGEMAGQMMLMLAYDNALDLADLMLCEPPQTTKHLGTVERSALAELGNLTGSFFLNAVARYTGFSARPSPPAVMVDMAGAILDVVIATYGNVGTQVLMLQVAFLGEDRAVQADFWVIPDPASLTALAHRAQLSANHGQ